jgi:NAD(P)H-dependent FMN reductase
VVREIEEIYRGLGEPFNVLDLANLPRGIFDSSSYAQKPAEFKVFSDAILSARGLVVVSPEYNGGMPGVLKYFIDMLKFPESFESRPVCFVGLAAGVWGALRPIEQLQLIFGYRNAFIYPVRVFLPTINDKLDEAGRLRDPELRRRLEEQARGFIDFMKRVRGEG